MLFLVAFLFQRISSFLPAQRDLGYIHNSNDRRQEAVLLLIVMPGFSFVSGYLSSPDMTWSRAWTTLTMLIVYHIFIFINWLNGTIGIVALSAINRSRANSTHNGGANSTMPTTGPHFPIPFYQPTEIDHRPDGSLPVTWFLMALIFWRVLTPLLAKLHRPLLTSNAIGLLMLCTDAGFGTQQIGSYLPFFVLGFHFRHDAEGKESWKNWVRNSVALSVGFASVGALSIGISIFAPGTFAIFNAAAGHGFGCLYGISTGAHCASWQGLGSRVFMYLLSPFAMLGFFSLVPQAEVPFLTSAGRWSINVYLWHPIVLFNIASYLGLFLIFKAPPPFSGFGAFVVLTIFALISFAILSLECWIMSCCCWTCIKPPVVPLLFDTDRRMGSAADCEEDDVDGDSGSLEERLLKSRV